MKTVCEWCNSIFDLPFLANVNHGIYCSKGCRSADELFNYMMSEEGQESLMSMPARKNFVYKVKRRKICVRKSNSNK